MKKEENGSNSVRVLTSAVKPAVFLISVSSFLSYCRAPYIMALTTNWFQSKVLKDALHAFIDYTMQL